MLIKQTMTYERGSYRNNYSGTEKIIHYIFVMENNVGAHIALFYYPEYTQIDRNKDKSGLTLPSKIKVIGTKISTREEILSVIKRKTVDCRCDSCEYEVLDKKPEDLALKTPEWYKDNGAEYIEEVDPDISDDLLQKVKEAIKNTRMPMPIGIYGENLENADSDDESRWMKFFCPKCKKPFELKDESIGTSSCPMCGKHIGYSTEILCDKKLKDHRNKNYNIMYTFFSLSQFAMSKKNSIYYMQAHPNGISLYKISNEITLNGGKYTNKYAIESSIIHKLGEEICAYKHLKKGKKKCDPFEVLNINTKNINRPPKIIYEDAENFMQFARKNEKVFRMIGLLEMMKYSQIEIDIEAFFIAFLGIMNKYPVMEQIVKSGHFGLYFSLYDKMKASESKNEINDSVNSIAQLVNTETTKGKDALRFPAYIGDYLIKKRADISEYYYWRDIYEITQLSKEQFEEIINSFDYAYVVGSVGFENISNILKYGYRPEKLISYIVKESDKGGSIDNVIFYLKDYLEMCELTEIQPDKFPMDLRKQHDEMVAFMRKNKIEKEDKKIAMIGKQCEDYMPQDIYDEKGKLKPGIPKLLEDYVVIFPKSAVDLKNEGNMQHNCVGSYSRRIKEGYSVIFFIRNKETPNQSFITGECTRSGLGQFKLSNNRNVTKEELVSLGKYVAGKILTGIRSEKIQALNKIS